MHARGGHATSAAPKLTLNILQLDAILRSALHELDEASVEAVCLCAAQACDAAGQCNVRTLMLSLPEHGEAGLCAAKLLGRMIMQGTDNVESKRADFYRFFSEHDRRRGTNFLTTFPEMSSFWQQCEYYANRSNI